jgi:spore maturation protein CgeB
MHEPDRARLLIVGFHGGASVGDSLARAAAKLAISVAFVDAAQAFAAPRFIAAAAWHLADHRPVKLTVMSRHVVSECARVRPEWLISTGLAPVSAEALEEIGRHGVTRINFLTDDPWNPRLSSRWFLSALRHYDRVFTPRRANISDLLRHGCAVVSYLPFGVDPELSFHQPPSASDDLSRYSADVVFVGGADRDRVVYADALVHAGLKVALYGGYWDRYRHLRAASRGLADLETVRKATSAAKVALCLVRHANRDGHVMRSLEIPVIGACMLVEDTDEHRELFGPPGDAVVYFSTVAEMLERLHWLLEHDRERQRLAAAVERRIRAGGHQYEDRLLTMLAFSQADARQPVLAS